ncbi:DUF2304 domain-containing protein [Moorellaceae bacterium AZ2]
MNFNVYTFSVIFSIGFLILVIEFVRKGALLEQYSLFWIFFALAMLVLSIDTRILDLLSRLLHIYYAPSVLFLLGFLFIIIYSFHLTVILSSQAEKLLRLTQELAILKNKVEEIENKVEVLK